MHWETYICHESQIFCWARILKTICQGICVIKARFYTDQIIQATITDETPLNRKIDKNLFDYLTLSFYLSYSYIDNVPNKKYW